MKLLIDVGSTYIKTASAHGLSQHFRDFSRPIHEDLRAKCGDLLQGVPKEDVYICSSANGGLSTLIIGLTHSFSLKYAKNIAYNAGINIIDTVLYKDIAHAPVPGDVLDVVILVGGIDSVGEVFDQKLLTYLHSLNYANLVYVGTAQDAPFIKANLPHAVLLPNIIDERLHIQEEPLKTTLTNLYQADIMGKEEIKELYAITANQIYPTPYIVNRALPRIGEQLEVVDPFIVLDIGGATTDIHYSKDLVSERLLTDNAYDRLVFKKLGVYKSKESLIHAAKQNEYVYELLSTLDVTEKIFEEQSEKALHVLMQLSIFLVLYKTSKFHQGYVTLGLERLESIVLTGGITKVLSQEECESILHFFYKKILGLHHAPAVVLDTHYAIWTLGITGEHHVD